MCTNEHKHGALRGIFTGLLQPVVKVIKWCFTLWLDGLLCKIIDQDNSCTVPIERFDNRPECLLTSCVPYLEFDSIVLYLYRFRFELCSWVGPWLPEYKIAYLELLDNLQWRSLWCIVLRNNFCRQQSHQWLLLWTEYRCRCLYAAWEMPLNSLKI